MRCLWTPRVAQGARVHWDLHVEVLVHDCAFLKPTTNNDGAAVEGDLLASGCAFERRIGGDKGLESYLYYSSREGVMRSAFFAHWAVGLV